MSESKVIFKYQGRLNKYREYERQAKQKRKSLQTRIAKRKHEVVKEEPERQAPIY